VSANPHEPYDIINAYSPAFFNRYLLAR